MKYQKMGELRVITGPMFSGKTEALQQHIRRFQLSGKRCLVINHASDTRYDDASHCQQRMEAIATNELQSILECCHQVDVIGIDESQFFPDLVEFVDHLTNYLDKIVIVAALDGTYEGKPFGRVAELLARAERFEKLSAVCLRCGRDAAFTIRKPNTVGASEQYEAVCRTCRGQTGGLPPTLLLGEENEYRSIMSFLDEHIKYVSKISQLKLIYPKFRMPNFPSEISENLVKYIIQFKYGFLPTWKDGKDTGDLRYDGQLFEVKCFSSDGPSSFGPNERWDHLFFLDATNYIKKIFKCYKININNQQFGQVIHVNSTETYFDQCQNGRRPRISFDNICQQIPRDNIELVFDGHISTLRSQYGGLSPP